MGRALLSHRLSDQSGTTQPYTSVLILELDGTTPLAQTLYVANTGAEVRTNPLTTDDLGMLVAYADTPQRAIARVTDGAVVIDTVIGIEDDPADLTSAPIPLANLAAPTSGYALVSNGTAVVGALLVNANVDPSAGIEHSKLASTTQHYVLRAAGGGTIGAGLLTNDNMSASAAFALTKIAHVGTGNVLKSNGTTNVAGQIVNADVDTAAAIAITKVAHVGAGNVLRSNGTTNAAGKVALGDLTSSAVSQRPAVGVGTTSPTTTSATAVALADPTVSFNTYGGDIDVHAVMTATCSIANGIISLYVRLDGGAWQTLGNATPESASNQRIQLHGFHRFTGVSGTSAVPVAHTVELGWATSTGTATAVHTVGGRRIMVTEVRA